MALQTNDSPRPNDKKEVERLEGVFRNLDKHQLESMRIEANTTPEAREALDRILAEKNPDSNELISLDLAEIKHFLEYFDSLKDTSLEKMRADEEISPEARKAAEILLARRKKAAEIVRTGRSEVDKFLDSDADELAS